MKKFSSILIVLLVLVLATVVFSNPSYHHWRTAGRTPNQGGTLAEALAKFALPEQVKHVALQTYPEMVSVPRGTEYYQLIFGRGEVIGPVVCDWTDYQVMTAERRIVIMENFTYTVDRFLVCNNFAWRAVRNNTSETPPDTSTSETPPDISTTGPVPNPPEDFKYGVRNLGTLFFSLDGILWEELSERPNNCFGGEYLIPKYKLVLGGLYFHDDHTVGGQEFRVTAGLRFNKFFGRFHSNVEYGGGASFSLRRRVLLVEDPFGDREIASSNNFGVWGKVVLYTVHGSALELKMDWDQEQWGYGIDMKIQPGIFYSNAIITQRFGRGLTTKIDGGIFLFQDPTVFTVNELRLGIRIFRDKSLLIYWTPMLRWQAEEREQKRWTVNWKGYGGGVEYKLPFRRVPLTIRGFIWNMERKDIWNEWTGGPWREIRSGLGITYEL